MTPTPVGVQISEDVPIPGEVLVFKGIRIIEIYISMIRVPEEYPNVIEYPKKIKLPDPTRPEKMFYPHTPSENSKYQ